MSRRCRANATPFSAAPTPTSPIAPAPAPRWDRVRGRNDRGRGRLGFIQAGRGCSRISSSVTDLADAGSGATARRRAHARRRYEWDFDEDAGVGGFKEPYALDRDEENRPLLHGRLGADLLKSIAARSRGAGVRRSARAPPQLGAPTAIRPELRRWRDRQRPGSTMPPSPDRRSERFRRRARSGDCRKRRGRAEPAGNPAARRQEYIRSACGRSL